MVVHRSDATQQRRMASNHDELMAKLKLALPNCTVDVFIGKDYDLAQTIARFNEADVVIATHGAALSFIPFIRPGRAVIEIGYQKFGPGRGMPFPLSFYYAVAVSVGVKYYFSMGDGAYIGQTKLDVDDVVQLATWAVGNMTIWPMGSTSETTDLDTHVLGA
mmetsp:Transcript_49518/g.140276  ORF Transcript_49518/g.140276 Transcript_49518/m.140276 type:complete len:162 (-) Transcript_49518:58-543(-)